MLRSNKLNSTQAMIHGEHLLQYTYNYLQKTLLYKLLTNITLEVVH